MVKLSILIVDDESLARERVRAFLKSRPEVEIAGECADGLEALDRIRSLRPDIVFMDVQMPTCDGLQVLAKLSAAERPAIVLVTAHNRFAVEAFREQVVDFLLKPFDRTRFELALKRAAEHVCARRSGDLLSQVEEVISTAPSHPPSRLAVRVDGRIVLLRFEEIVWLEAANNYSFIHLVGKERLMVRETLSSLERRLEPGSFTKIHRSTVVRVDRVQELQPTKYGDYMVVLRDGTRLPLSRGLRGRLAAFVSGGL